MGRLFSIPVSQDRIGLLVYNENPLCPVYFSTILYLFPSKTDMKSKQLQWKCLLKVFDSGICYADSVGINYFHLNHWLHSKGKFTGCSETWRGIVRSAATCSSMVVQHVLGRVACQTVAKFLWTSLLYTSSSVATWFSRACLNLQLFLLNLCLSNACIGSEKQFLSLPVLNLQWTFNWIIQPRCQWVIVFCN